jgi:hypothetical protein
MMVREWVTKKKKKKYLGMYQYFLNENIAGIWPIIRYLQAQYMTQVVEVLSSDLSTTKTN